jgi:hypothetical protein
MVMITVYLLEHAKADLRHAEIQLLEQALGPVDFQTVYRRTLIERYDKTTCFSWDKDVVLVPRGWLPTLPDALTLRRIPHYRFKYFPDVPTGPVVVRITSVVVSESMVRSRELV